MESMYELMKHFMGRSLCAKNMRDWGKILWTIFLYGKYGQSNEILYSQGGLPVSPRDGNQGYTFICEEYAQISSRKECTN